MFAIQNQTTGKFLYGTLLSWLENWKMRSQMLVGFLIESNRLLTSEDLSDLAQFGAVKVENANCLNKIENN